MSRKKNKNRKRGSYSHKHAKSNAAEIFSIADHVLGGRYFCVGDASNEVHNPWLQKKSSTVNGRS